MPTQCLVHLTAAGYEGVDGFPVAVEVARTEPTIGIGRTTVVGLPDSAVRESIDRVTPALAASGLSHRPGDHVVVNLAPADRRKEGPAFDLAIALGLAASDRDNQITLPDDTCFVAELALDGHLRPVRGVLAIALAARDAGLKRIVVAPGNANEAAVVSGLTVHAPTSLSELIEWFQAGFTQPPSVVPKSHDEAAWQGPDLADVRGQEHAKRALMIAAAGQHNLLFVGPPGSGKTMLARRLPGILPPLTDEEALEVSKIASVAGHQAGHGGLIRQRPFRAPHHSISAVGLIGGGSVPRPGEVSLAHHGVLFLDELPEFPRAVLEHLRQPLEDGSLTISRAAARLDFPSRCMLVAAMNPCPCGYLGHPTRACQDSRDQIHRYRGKISGPLLDRIDCHVEVPAQRPAQLNHGAPGPSSAEVRRQVIAARQAMLVRQGCPNGHLAGAALRRHAEPTADARGLLDQALEELGLSARAHDRILRVARTITDLDDPERQPGIDAIAEAIGYRLIDRQSW